MGYDTPKPLGARETGGGLVLPIWVDYMQTAVKDQPETVRVRPDSVVERGGLLYYRDPVKGPGLTEELLGSKDENDLVRNQIF